MSLLEITAIVGERLKNYREQAGLSQEELAELAGCHRTYIGQIENAKKNPSIENIGKIARALNISLETLFENIIEGDNEEEIASACYKLIQSQPLKEQEKLYDILKQIVDYKK
ncbi:helix-turn-helix transcriptional regulator [Clostridium sp. D33t1_170424_F3]|uniref:helix-turn-helix domain-containing protein n=1 Tax=Clostridium sp. D33t1_170424_F3 TaxID=2787099 RepID=UPI0018AB79DC|nr:helix-turn-helix transcriptional regulator [Clostridium sp. D33t1_170424_F3]